MLRELTNDLSFELSVIAESTMQDIVISDEELTRLEKRFGPDIRQMGPWLSDGVFAYISVPIAAVEKAAQLLNDRSVLETVSHLRTSRQWTAGLMDLLQSCPDLLDRIIFVERHHLSEMPSDSNARRRDQVVDWQFGQNSGAAFEESLVLDNCPTR